MTATSRWVSDGVREEAAVNAVCRGKEMDNGQNAGGAEAARMKGVLSDKARKVGKSR